MCVFFFVFLFQTRLNLFLFCHPSCIQKLHVRYCNAKLMLLFTWFCTLHNWYTVSSIYSTWTHTHTHTQSGPKQHTPHWMTEWKWIANEATKETSFQPLAFITLKRLMLLSLVSNSVMQFVQNCKRKIVNQTNNTFSGAHKCWCWVRNLI